MISFKNLDQNLIKNYFENLFEEYISKIDSMPFKESYTQDYVLDPESNNSQFPYYIGIMKSLELHTTIPENKADIMSWKNLINNYYGLLIEADHYIYEIFLYADQIKSKLIPTNSKFAAHLYA